MSVPSLMQEHEWGCTVAETFARLTAEVWKQKLSPWEHLFSEAQKSQINKAWMLRWNMLQQQTRAMTSETERFEQGLVLLELLARLHVDVDAVMAGLLVEPVQMRLCTVEEVAAQLGRNVARLCQQISTLPSFVIKTDIDAQEQRIQRKSQLRSQAEMFRQMLLVMSQDLRVVLVLLVVGLHRLRYLAFTLVEQQMQVAWECRDIYAPLANRLGMSWIKNELEDLTLRYLYPHDFYNLVRQINDKREVRDSFVKEVQRELQRLLTEQKIPGRVLGRPKHLNSIFRKMSQRQLNLDELYDITAFRLILTNKEHCYQMLGAIHDKWKPIPGRFKDYIALPKSNMYQSLHTTVLGPDSKRMEIQLRTEEMDRLAEEGIAAHWLYKESGSSSGTEGEGAKAASDVQWLRSLIALQDEKADEDAFVANVRDHLFVSKVFVFTPKGDIRELRRGATPLDFAYAIHSEIGHHCVGARVNHKMVPLRYELRNGDMVDILTSPSATPKRDWLEVAKSSRAKTKIRAYLRIEQRQQAIQDGRERLERSLSSSQPSLTQLRKNGELDRVAERMGLSSLDELFAQIGHGMISKDYVLRLLFPVETREPTPLQEPPVESAPKKTRAGGSTGAVLVEGWDDILVDMARCCHPIPGDPIVGFISRGRGVIVHQRNCPRLLKAEEQRQIAVRWASDSNRQHTVNLRVITENRQAILARISEVFDELRIPIARAHCYAVGEEFVNHFRCSISNMEQLQRLIRQLSEIRGVFQVERLRN